jgi:hypothetical protein
MGLFTKILLILVVVGLLFWVYTSVKVDTMTICVSHEVQELEVTCVEDVDCSRYLTSLYGSYPDTAMYRFVLSQTSSCDLGKCNIRDFRFEDVCEAGEMPVVYKVTAEELVSVR